MKILPLIILFFILANCSKPKTVLVCGDHVCVNKTEAEQYFEENLSIEVKILDNKVKEEFDLVKLNLKENQEGKKQISISSRESTEKVLKDLSKEEIIGIKKNIKNKKSERKIVKNTLKKREKNKKQVKAKEVLKTDKIKQKKNTVDREKINTQFNNVVDVCTILEKCTIDEISKYLLEQAKNKNYPNITTRQ
jgi:hypothetical protein|tara:strand:- start:3295 stop:3873 length:579 start_codon:yes stop_codon:yes gene_type:complete